MTSFITNLTSLIWDYIAHPSRYPLNSKLLIEPILGETVIDDPTQSRGCEQYDLNYFVSKNEHGSVKPNSKSIKKLAKKLYKFNW
ncbi:MAG: hypothetical protein LKG14_04555 [Prevotella sp.]|uniref:Uncharacterized protein n=1 Tax=Segatella cerevisiae TaxID=2053716 RepID=A0ABT1BXW5_9BACT|nr:hypothetical protein [Segatella cerevisiae]MCH3995319.1 hypothetical protein [Prevotella sp.]MCI1246640.1 hypothetical protein [Prevotella sp.]MCO6025228.1 hypothetical protein [Segatella cerevisiae]